jgi:hypothetical protein
VPTSSIDIDDRFQHGDDFAEHLRLTPKDLVVGFETREEARRFKSWLTSIEAVEPWNLHREGSQLAITREFVNAIRHHERWSLLEDKRQLLQGVHGELPHLIEEMKERGYMHGVELFNDLQKLLSELLEQEG